MFERLTRRFAPPGQAPVTTPKQPPPQPDDRLQHVLGNGALAALNAGVLTRSVGASFVEGFTDDQIRTQAALLVDALENTAPEPGIRQVLEQNLELLVEHAAARGIPLPIVTTYEFVRVIRPHAEDIQRHLATLEQLLAGLDWHELRFGLGTVIESQVGKMAWVVAATGRAEQLVAEAAAGGVDSVKKFAEAGTELTAAIFGLRVLAILLMYDGFWHEAGKHPGSDLARRGAGMAHSELDSVLLQLSQRQPGSVDAAVKAVAGYNWAWAFNQMKDEVEEKIADRARFLQWVSIAMLALTAFEIWALPVAGMGGGSGPRIGGMGTASATATRTALSSAESLEALRRLAAIGAITSPRFVKLIGGPSGGVQAPPEPIATSGKTGGPVGGSTGKQSPEPAADPDMARVRKLTEWEKNGKVLGEVPDLRQRLRSKDPKTRQDARAEFEQVQQQVMRGEKPEIEAYRQRPARHAKSEPRSTPMSTSTKSELENSGWLKKRLPSRTDRRRFMDWLKERHKKGEQGDEIQRGRGETEGHDHYPPGAPQTEAVVKEWEREMGRRRD